MSSSVENSSEISNLGSISASLLTMPLSFSTSRRKEATSAEKR